MNQISFDLSLSESIALINLFHNIVIFLLFTDMTCLSLIEIENYLSKR